MRASSVPKIEIQPLSIPELDMPIQPLAFRDSHAVVSSPLPADSNRRPAEFTRGTGDAPHADGVPHTALHRWRGISPGAHETVHAGGKLGDYMCVERQLQKDPGAAQARSCFHKNTLLHEACIHWSGHPDQQFLIGVLIKHGVNVNATNSRGETALDTAVKKLGPGHGKNMQGHAIEQLLRHHASVTPGVVRRSEELARRGDPWLREAIAEQHPVTVRL